MSKTEKQHIQVQIMEIAAEANFFFTVSKPSFECFCCNWKVYI